MAGIAGWDSMRWGTRRGALPRLLSPRVLPRPQHYLSFFKAMGAWEAPRGCFFYL